MFCCALLYVHSSIAIILMGKRELVALLNLSSWCLVVVGWLFLAVPRGCLQFVIVVFPDHTHLLFLTRFHMKYQALFCFLKVVTVQSLYNTPHYNTDLDITCHGVAKKKVNHGILQRNYKKMTIKWPFSYVFFAKLSL